MRFLRRVIRGVMEFLRMQWMWVLILVPLDWFVAALASARLALTDMEGGGLVIATILYVVLFMWGVAVFFMAADSNPGAILREHRPPYRQAFVQMLVAATVLLAYGFLAVESWIGTPLLPSALQIEVFWLAPSVLILGILNLIMGFAVLRNR